MQLRLGVKQKALEKLFFANSGRNFLPNVGGIKPELKYKRVSTMEMFFGFFKTFWKSLLSELLRVVPSEVVFSATETFYGM